MVSRTVTMHIDDYKVFSKSIVIFFFSMLDKFMYLVGCQLVKHLSTYMARAVSISLTMLLYYHVGVVVSIYC